MRFFDGLRNLVSGLGTGKDKGSFNAFYSAELTSVELNAMHRGDWLARKIVDIVPQDMTREWRAWQAENPQIEAIEEAERALGVRQKVNEALQRARLLGGAGIFIGTKDTDPAEELRPERIGKDGITYLHVLSKEDVTADTIIKDVMSPFYGRPAFYQMTGADGTLVKIHPSRIIPFIGAPIFDKLTTGTDPWGDSILKVVYSAVQNAASSQEHIASLIPEAKVDIIKVPGLSDVLGTSAGTQKLIERFTLANTLKSSINAVLLEGDGQSGETWEQKTINFTQFPELMRLYLQIAAGAADIPATRLLSQSPAGLNATGDADIRNYYDHISSRQEVELRPTIAPLDEMLIRHALGGRPKEIHYRWAPLWQMTDTEKADIAKKKAETTQIYVGAALIPSDALARATVNQLIEDGTYPGLEGAIDDSATTPEEFVLAEEEQAKQAAAAQAEAARQAQRQAQPTADAAPRTLYVRRDVVNRAEIAAWAKEQGFTDIVPDLHVTIAYSTTPVDWFKVGTSWAEKVEIAAGGPRQMDALGPTGKYLALLITANELVWRNREIRDAGASWDWPDYQPHISIQIGGDIDLTKVKPYQGKIVLGPEIFEEVRSSDE